MNKKFWLWLLFILFVYLQYRLWFAQHGLVYFDELKKSVKLQKETNTKVKNCNQKLAEEILYYQSNRDALEEKARFELDMIKAGETFISINDGDEKIEVNECDAL